MARDADVSSGELPIRVLAGVYLDIKREVIDAGFAWEIDWQSSVNLADLTESAFLREAGWVILSSGMSEAVIRKRFAEISAAFMDWCDARRIVRRQSQRRRRALKHFNHPCEDRRDPQHRTLCRYTWSSCGRARSPTPRRRVSTGVQLSRASHGTPPRKEHWPKHCEGGSALAANRVCTSVHICT